jgi:uncharacterized protein (TIGR02611 family)
MKRLWQELKRGKPGRRFQSRHEKARRGGLLRKWALIVGGALLVLAGIVFLPLPGPGMLIILAGALLMAEESRGAARALDWMELRFRSVFSSPRRSR